MLTRRSAIKALAIGAGTTLAPTLPSFAATQADPILRAAKAIAKKPGQKLRILLPRGSEANVAPVASAFSEATEVTIDFVFADVDLVNIKILSDQLTGVDNFDIALPATFGLPDLIEANALLPLDKLDAAYGNALGSHSSLYDHGDSFLGKRYGFQTGGDVYVMFYRRSWLENADNQAAYKAQTGDDLKVPQTWTELDQQMRFFHKPENGRYGGALFRNANYLVWEWWIRLHANGGQPVDTNFNPTINSPAGIAALEALIASTADLYPGPKRTAYLRIGKPSQRVKSTATLAGADRRTITINRTPQSATTLSLVQRPVGWRMGQFSQRLTLFGVGTTRLPAKQPSLN